MTRIGLVLLICALTSGNFGGLMRATFWERSPFFIFLSLAVAAFTGSLLSRPSLFWEVMDDIHHRRYVMIRSDDCQTAETELDRLR